MSENHELRVKIDAGAAERGSRQFVAAVQAIKTAVKGMERDASGAFLKLHKNIEKTNELGQIKLGFDKRALNEVEKYAQAQAQALRSVAATRKEVKALKQDIMSLGTAYSQAHTSIDLMNKALLQTNANLKRQIQLASAARSAVRQIRAAPIESAPSTRGQGRNVAREQSAQAGAVEKVNTALNRQENLQNRITRAIDNQRAATASLMASLAKAGGTSEIDRLAKAFVKFQTELSSSTANAKTLDDAQTRLNHVQKTARVALTRMNASLAEQKEDMREAATAAREQARAFQELIKAAHATERAQIAAGRASAQQEALQYQAARAMRSAEVSAQRLSERLRTVGATGDIPKLNSALEKLKTALGGNVTHANQIRRALDDFQKAAQSSTSQVIRLEAAKRRDAEASRAAAAAAAENARQLRTIGMASSTASAHVHKLTGNMRGLENQFQATYQAGSAFRTMLGGLTLGHFVQETYKAGRSLEQFMVTMEIATGSIQGALREDSFISGLASDLGTDLRTAREDFAKFAVSAELAGASTQQTQNIFESVSMALSVMGRGAEDQRLAFLALEQMMSKGTVSSEELRRQLGERLPGAVNLMAKALNVTTAELQDLLKAGAIDSASALPKFAEEVTKAFGPGLQAATKRASFNIGTFRNEIENFLATVAGSGFTETIAIEFARLTQLMRSEEIRQFAESIGQNLANATSIAVGALQFLAENLDLVRTAFGTLLASLAIGKLANYTAMVRDAGEASRAAAAQKKLLAAQSVATTAQTVRATAATDALASAQARAALTSRQLIVGTRASAAAMGAYSAAAAAVGASLRGLAATLLPVLGIIAAGYAITEGIKAWNSWKEAGEQAADEVSNAIRRSGVEFDSLQGKVENVGRARGFSLIIQDIVTLESAVQSLNGTMDAYYVSLANSIQKAKIGEESGFLGRAMQGATDFVFGTNINETDDALAGASPQALRSIEELHRGMRDVANGSKAALDQVDDLFLALERTPTAAPAVQQMLAQIGMYAQAERALVQQQNKMVAFEGTQSDRDLMGLAENAARALGSDQAEDVIRVREEAERLRKEYEKYPEVLARVDAIFDQFMQAEGAGNSPTSFMRDVQPQFSSSIAALQEAARAQAEFDQKSAAAAASFQQASNSAVSGLHEMADAGEVSRSAIDEVLKVLDQFSNGNVNVSLEDFDSLSTQLKPVSSAMRELIGLTRQQFSALSQSEQSYANLSQIIANLGQEHEHFAGASEMLAAALGASEGVMDANAASARDLGDTLRDMFPEGSEADALMESLVQTGAHLQGVTLDATLATEALRRLREEQAQARAAEERRAELDDSLARGGSLVKTAESEMRGVLTERATEADIESRPEHERELYEIHLQKNAALQAEIDLLRQRAETESAQGTNVEDIYSTIEALEGKKQALDAVFEAEARAAAEQAAYQEKTRAINEATAAIEKHVAGTDRAIQSDKLLKSGIAATKEQANLLVSAMQAIGSDGSPALDQSALAAELMKNNLELSQQQAYALAAAMIAVGSNTATAAAQVAQLAGQITAATGAAAAQGLQPGASGTPLSTGGGGGGGKEEDPIGDFRKSVEDRLKSVEQMTTAFKLQAAGITETAESAQMLAEAYQLGDSATIAWTRNMVQMIDAAEKLNKKLEVMAQDPVKDWVNSVPTWLEAGREIEVEVFDSLSNEISEFIKTGKFSFESLADSILDTVADTVSQMATRELMSLFGMGGQDGKYGFGLGDKLQGLFGYSKGSMFDPDNGGYPGAEGALPGSDVSANMMKTGIEEGGRMAAEMLKNALAGQGSSVLGSRQGAGYNYKYANNEEYERLVTGSSSGVIPGAGSMSRRGTFSSGGGYTAVPVAGTSAGGGGVVAMPTATVSAATRSAQNFSSRSVAPFQTGTGTSRAIGDMTASEFARSAGIDMQFMMGPKRPNMANTDILNSITAAVEDSFGKGAKIEVYSGKGDYGSARHRGGHAADFRIRGADGNLVHVNSPEARSFMANAGRFGITGMGAGTEYMGANGFHMDNFPLERYSSGMGQYWGSAGKQVGEQFVQATRGAQVDLSGLSGAVSQQTLGNLDLGFDADLLAESGPFADLLNDSGSTWEINKQSAKLAQGIRETADAIGLSAEDLATMVSYETAGTFNPAQPGPRTQWGQHRGLIQFGEPQANSYGVDWNRPLESQLGADGAVARYLKASGFRPGMSGLQAYSTINAGSPFRTGATDAYNGGAPGTVADKWFNQMGAHRAKAQQLLNNNPAMSAQPTLQMDAASLEMTGNAELKLPGMSPISADDLIGQQMMPSLRSTPVQVDTGSISESVSAGVSKGVQEAATQETIAPATPQSVTPSADLGPPAELGIQMPTTSTPTGNAVGMAVTGQQALGVSAGVDAPDPAAVMKAALSEGGQAAGNAVSDAISTSGTQVSSEIKTGMTQAGTETATQVQQSGSVAASQMGTSVVTSGSSAGSQVGTSMAMAGRRAATMMTEGITQGGQQAAQQLQAAATSTTGGGGGGGGFLGGLFGGGGGGGLFGGMGGSLLTMGLGLLPQLFSKKDKDDDDDDDVEWIPAKSYSQGTANTSGIPAMLHQNEAVIPLTGNRKVPVELDGNDRGSRIVNQTFNITTPDADSFRRSQKQMAADAATAGRRALADNR